MKDKNKHQVSIVIAATLTMICVAPANAHNATSKPSPFHPKSRVYFHAGVTQLNLESGQANVVLSDLGAATSIAIDEGPVENSGANISGDTQPTLTIGYRFKSMPRLSIETAIAPPFSLDLTTTGALADESLAPFALGQVPTGIPALGAELGNAQALPAIASLVYTFSPVWRFEPYVGLGMTYVFTYDHKITNSVLTEDGNPQLDVAPAIGVVGQIGVNTQLTERLTLITDFKFARGIKTESEVTDISLISPTLGDLVGPATVGLADFELELDATVFNIAVRYKF